MPTTFQIRELGRDIILKHPGGIRFADIVAQIRTTFPDANKTTVEAQVANYLAPAYPSEITKPSRGLYKPLLGDSQAVVESAPTPAVTGLQREEDVYEPVAQWLKNDIEEATEAVPLGGSGLRTKWGTPDVVGVYKPLASQLIKFSPEIVAVEIKLDPTQPVGIWPVDSVSAVRG